MNSRLYLNLILGFLVLIVAGIAILSDDGPMEQRPSGLAGDPAGEPARIQIRRRGQDDIIMKWTPAGWHIERPVIAPVNPDRVDAILAQMEAPVIASFTPPMSSLAEYGLDPSGLTLLIDDKVLEYGEVNPLDEGRYILFRDVVYIVKDYLYPQLIQPVDFFINRQIIEFNLPPARIHCGETTLVRTSEGWQRQAPGAPPNIKLSAR